MQVMVINIIKVYGERCPIRPSKEQKVVILKWSNFVVFRFYRAMHFSAKRGIAIACRLSVRLSVCL